MSLWRRLGLENRRRSSNARIVRQCRTHWIQSGLPDPVVEELCLDLEDSLEEASEHGYPPEVVLGESVQWYAEEQARAFMPLRKRGVTGYKLLLVALISVCAVFLPQHILARSLSFSLGWTEILAAGVIFAVISLLQWPWFSARTYNGRLPDGVFFPGDSWAFVPGILLGYGLQVYDVTAAAEGVIGWSWPASLALIALSVVVHRLHARAKGGGGSPRLAEQPEGEVEPDWLVRVSLWLAVFAFLLQLAGWSIARGPLQDLAAIMLLASSIVLVGIFPALKSGGKGPTISW